MDQGRRDLDEEEVAEKPPSGGRLKAALAYSGLVAVPLALVALGGAVLAVMDGRAAQTRAKEVSADLQAAKESLAATRNELESLKFIVARQKAQLDAERKQEEPAPVTPQPPARQHAAEPVVHAPQQPDRKAESKTEMKAETKPPAAVTTKPPVKAAEKPVPDQTLTTAPDKSGKKQLQGVREAIKKFNQ